VEVAAAAVDVVGELRPTSKLHLPQIEKSD